MLLLFRSKDHLQYDGNRCSSRVASTDLFYAISRVSNMNALERIIPGRKQQGLIGMILRGLDAPKR